MHPRNLYNNKPDFGELAEVRPSLKPYLIPKSKQTTKQCSDQQQPTDHEKSPNLTLTSSNSVTLSLDTDTNQEKEHQQHFVVTDKRSPSSSSSLLVADHVEQQSEKKFAYTLDFSDPAALRELTCAVLQRDFGLKVKIPLDKLIPAVPQRLNYVHWIEDLLMCCEDDERRERESGASRGADSANKVVVGVVSGGADSAISEGAPMEVEGVVSDRADSTLCEVKKKDLAHCHKEGVASGRADDATVPKGEAIIGIDIGTGASCIYPLLGTSLNGWRFLATEIDDEAVKFARENVSRNKLEQKIEVKQVSPSTILLGAVDSTTQYSFCMCNPPFFKDREERYGGGASRSELRPPPSTFSSGTLSETVTEGGEVEFVKRIIHDSLTLRSSVRWYSSMLGKKTSVKQILSDLKQHEVPVMTTTEFVQGKTWRWGVAWSFDETIKDRVQSISKPSPKKQPSKRQRPLVLTLPTQIGFDVRESFSKAKEWFLEQLTQLQIDYTYSTTTNESKVAEKGEREGSGSSPMVVRLHCVAKRNTWSHQRRKRRLLEKLQAQQSLMAQGTNGGIEIDTKERRLQSTSGESLTDTVTTFLPTSIGGCTQLPLANDISSFNASSSEECPIPARVTTTDKASPNWECVEIKNLSSDSHNIPASSDGNVSSNSIKLDSKLSQNPEDIPVQLPLVTPPSSPSKAPAEAERRKVIHQEIESLSPPCQVEFECCLLTEHPEGNIKNPTQTHLLQGVKKAKLCDEGCGPSKMKSGAAIGTNVSSREPGSKVKGRRATKLRSKGGASLRDCAESASGEPGPEQLLIEFEWISGDNKDMLHQIVQYFRNKCQNIKF